MLERLQKILSARGIASRRKAEEYITQGLVKVNGKVAVLGQKADPDTDAIEVDGRVLESRQEMLYYVMHKPRGVITTNATHATKQTLEDIVPKELRGKVFPVGRLDKDSEGLLLFSNDGALAYRLTHPKFDHEKEYEVTTEEPIKDGQLIKLREGMMILGEKTKPATVKRVGPAVFRIAITEGKNRQIRRMCQKVGSSVSRLVRVRIMTLSDAHLKPGQMRKLKDSERVALLQSVGLESRAV